MQCVKVPFLLSQGISCLTTCFYKSEVFRQSLRALSKKKDCKSVKAVELVFGQLKVAGGPDFFCSPPSHLGLSSINRSRSSERFCHWSTLKYTETSFGGSVPLSGPTKYRCQNAGTVLPLPGNRVGVARSVERDAVWWIGFSWSFECKIPPPPTPCRRAEFSAAKSCYRIRPCSVLSDRSTYCNIFSQIDGENQGCEEEESNTLILSEMLGWSLYLLY